MLWAVIPFLVIFVIVALYPQRAYNSTFIDYKIPLFGSIAAGVLFAAIFSFNNKNRFYLFIPFGVMAAAIFFFLNTTFADKKDVIYKAMINVKHHGYGKSGPYVEIKYRYFTKDIPAASNQDVDSSSYVILAINKGLFGYDIIREGKLVKD